MNAFLPVLPEGEEVEKMAEGGEAQRREESRQAGVGRRPKGVQCAVWQ